MIRNSAEESDKVSPAMKEPLASCPVVIEIPIAWGDMNAMCHVSNVMYFRYFESSRFAYFEKLGGWEYVNQTGIGPILASIGCRFKVPLTYPDTLSVGTRISRIEEDRFVMESYIMSHRAQAIAAEGEAVMVSYNYRENKKIPLPEEWKQRIRTLEQSVT